MLPSTGGATINPDGLVHTIGGLWLPIMAAGLVMGGLYILATMLAGVSTMRYAIVGFYGRRGMGKSFSAVYYARKWAQKYLSKDVWTNMARLDVEGRAVCIGEVRDWDAVTADGKKGKGFTLRHHVHNQRDCWRCAGNPTGHEHSESRCFECDLKACARGYTARVRRGVRHNWLTRLLRRKLVEEGEHSLLADREPVPLVHVESEYIDFAHAYDGLVLVDEAGQVFASTMWARLPFAAVKFMADTRKRRLLLLYTAHVPARVSKNLRELTDEAFQCTNYKGFGFFKLTHWEGCLAEADQSVYVPFLKSVQSAYDTEEIVTPPGGLVSMSEAVGRRESKAAPVAA